ncbi:MAG: hypothetical protein QXD43_01445 [Candidatus Aenigmatarchaeota archaeon]
MNSDKKKAIVREHLEVENGKYILFKAKNSNNKQKSNEKANSNPYACEDCGSPLVRTMEGIYACGKCGLERPDIIESYQPPRTKTDIELSEIKKRDIEESSGHEWQVY